MANTRAAYGIPDC